MGVNVGGKAIPASFRKIEGRRTLVGAKDRREGRIGELVGGQNPDPEASPRSKKVQEKKEQRNCYKRRSEEMTQSNTSSPRGSEVPLESQRG